MIWTKSSGRKSYRGSPPWLPALQCSGLQHWPDHIQVTSPSGKTECVGSELLDDVGSMMSAAVSLTTGPLLEVLIVPPPQLLPSVGPLPCRPCGRTPEDWEGIVD